MNLKIQMLQNAPGTFDYNNSQLTKINKIINTVRKFAIGLGATEIDTPTLEYTNLLLKKYGEEAETKLIYKIARQDEKEECKLAMRYDFTIPLTRYIMTNGLDSIKRFQAGKVYRKDLPNISQGRYCEFYQADLDIVGDYGEMIPEAEIMKLITLVMSNLGITKYKIKYNYRQNLLAIVNLSKINKKKFKTVCTSIDKLDKQPWEYVEKELLEKGILEESIKLLKQYLDENYLDESCVTIPDKMTKGNINLNDLFLKYTKIFNCPNIEFDAKLARGLDYYTGIIYEVVSTDENKLGSIIAGGRYDKLIYKNRKKSRVYIPAIGVSFGVNRIEKLISEVKEDEIESVYVVSQPDFIEKKLEIVNIMVSNGYRVEYITRQMKNVKQINNAIKNDFNWVLIYGENKDNIIVKKNDQSKDKLCKIDEIVNTIESFSKIEN